METKLIFDCTKPVDVDFPTMCRVPPDVVARMNPADWLEDLDRAAGA
jgi:hypothetical protein